jgi:ABC-type amino acid transport substrate-binding protein
MTKSYKNLIEVPATVSKIFVYAYSTNPKIKSVTPNNLNNYSSVYLGGYKVIEKIVGNGFWKKAQVLNKSETLWKMINLGRVDIALHIGRFADEEIKRRGYTKIIKISPPLVEKTLHMILHKKKSALLPKVDKALRYMKKDGTLSKLLDNKK